MTFQRLPLDIPDDFLIYKQIKISLDINLPLPLCLNQPQIEEFWTALGQRIPMTVAELLELNSSRTDPCNLKVHSNLIDQKVKT